MKHLFYTSLIVAAFSATLEAQTVKRIVCHDPSIFMDTITTGTPQTPIYYIYGSHLGNGKTTAAKSYISWDAFASGEGATGVNKLFVDANGNNSLYSNVYGIAHDWQYTGYSVRGNQWAPDVIWNKKMKKWCMYMSLNGDHWCSSIVLFTSDRPDYGWKFVGPVVFSGFQGTYAHNGFAAANDYKHTDLEKVIGTQSTLPSRYKVGDKWGEYWPNCIDPCVFYDEEGKLWMSYGSWSGGIFIFQLDESTGLRDYTITYPSTCSTAGDYRTATSDPYFGKKIAGGYYVSGEASYIQHIGKYYYLFMSYGGLSATGDYYGVGYQMRVFRSEKPDGPYKDCLSSSGQSAIYSSYFVNFGKDTKADRGVRLMSAYKWDEMSKGEIAQGHNSAIIDHLGRALLVYHTRQVASDEGHSVRVHQLFQNQEGWLVAAPFEFYGNAITQEDIDTKQLYDASLVAGDYQIIVHKYRQDAVGQEYATPETITLNPDGTITGKYTGSWALTDNTGYIRVSLKGLFGTTTTVAFKGVTVEQTINTSTKKRALCFTAISSSSGSTGANTTRGLCIWGKQTAVAVGINEIASEAETPDATPRDLLGRPASSTYKGVMISNGKKMIVR